MESVKKVLLSLSLVAAFAGASIASTPQDLGSCQPHVTIEPNGQIVVTCLQSTCTATCVLTITSQGGTAAYACPCKEV